MLRKPSRVAFIQYTENCHLSHKPPSSLSRPLCGTGGGVPSSLACTQAIQRIVVNSIDNFKLPQDCGAANVMFIAKVVGSRGNQVS